MKKLFKNKSMLRVAFIALSVLFIENSTFVAKAATVDDLRELIGDRRITDETLIQDMKSIIYKYSHSKYQKELVELLESMGDFGYQKKYEQLMQSKDESLKTLEDSFKANDEVKAVIVHLNDSLSILSELGALKQPNTVVLNMFGEDDEEEAYEYAASVLQSLDDNYEIGMIGEGVTPPTKNQFKIYKAYGDLVYAGENAIIEENRGIDLFVAYNPEEGFQSEIVSQFNGVVSAIEKFEQGYRITIEHGQALITTYEYLSEVKVKEGQNVKQYDLIGYPAAQTVHFEVILNTVPVNPVFLYGTAGIVAYDNWYASYPGMAKEKTDFTNVLKEIEQEDEKKNEVIQSTVESDESDEVIEIIMEEGYQKPDTPSLETIVIED